MGRTGDVGSGGRPAGRISQRALHQERPHARRRDAREAEKQPFRAHLRDGGRHVRPPEIRDDRPDALLRALLHALLRHLSQRRRLRTHPAGDGNGDALEIQGGHDASRRMVRHDALSRRSYSASSADRSSASRSKRTSRRSPSSTSRGGFSRGRWPSAWCRFCSDKYCVSSW